MSELGTDVCCCRGNNHKIRSFGQCDVFHLMDENAVKGIHHDPVAGQLFEGKGSNELCGMFRHNNFHTGMQFDQSGCEISGFICGDSAGNS